MGTYINVDGEKRTKFEEKINIALGKYVVGMGGGWKWLRVVSCHILAALCCGISATYFVPPKCPGPTGKS
jgi:hypothetical protein